jgi:predicted transcriptional regulator of viral defense system
MSQLSAQHHHELGHRGLALLERIQRSGRAVVRIDRDRNLFRDRDNAERLAVQRLANGGWLSRLERGAYVVAGPGRTARHSQLAIVADWLEGEPYVVTGFFALAHWNLTNQPPTTIDILLPRRKPNVEYGRTLFRFIQVPPERLPAEVREVDLPDAHARARMVSPERALTDIVAGRYSNDIDTANDAFERGFRLGLLRRSLLTEELRSAPAVAARRLGWIAEHHGDAKLADKLQPLVGDGGYAPLDPGRSIEDADRNARWRLLENAAF